MELSRLSPQSLVANLASRCSMEDDADRDPTAPADITAIACASMLFDHSDPSCSSRSPSLNSELERELTLLTRDPHDEIDSKEDAMAVFKDILFEGDLVGYLATLLRRLDHSENTHVQRAFAALIRERYCENSNLPGMVPGTTFNFVKAALNPRAPHSVACFVKTQAQSVLLRCLIALYVSKSASLFPSERIFEVVHLVHSWVDIIPDASANELNSHLLDLLWILKNHPLLGTNINRFAYSSELASFYADSSFSDLVSLLPPPAAPPSTSCLTDLPAPLLSTYNITEDFPLVVDDQGTWSLIGKILKEERLRGASSLTKACLLFLIPHSHPSLFQSDDEDDEDDDEQYSFQSLAMRDDFAEHFRNLFFLTTQMVLGVNEPVSEAIETVGRPLVINYTETTPVSIALLLIVVEQLEQSPPIDDQTSLFEALFLLRKIYPCLLSLPKPVKERTTRTLLGLLAQGNALLEKTCPDEWSSFREYKEFDVGEDLDLTPSFDTLVDFIEDAYPLVMLISAVSLTTPIPERATVFMSSLEMLRRPIKEELLDDTRVLPFFLFSNPSKRGSGRKVIALLEEADDEAVQVKESTALVATFLSEEENAQLALSNRTFCAAFLATATEVLEGQITKAD